MITDATGKLTPTDLAMENYVFTENPGQQQCEEMIGEILKTELRSRVKGEYEIWSTTQDYFLFLIAVDKRTNESAGCVSLTMDHSLDGNPDDDLYYIGGLYIKIAHRGFGLSSELLKRCMEKAKGKNVSLNSAVASVDYYKKKYGFSHYLPYFHATAKLNPTVLKLEGSNISGIVIKNVDEIKFCRIVAYDQLICQRERSKYLLKWLTGLHATSKVATDEEGNVVGFVCVRPQIVNRTTVGPFYANDENIAHDLLLSCLKDVPNLRSFDELWIRFPEPNECAIRSMLDKLTSGDYQTIPCVKNMFTKKLLEPNPNLIFSVFESMQSYV